MQLQDVRRKLQRFEEAHHAEILKGYQRRNRQRREIERQFDLVGEIPHRIASLVETLQLEDVPQGLFDAASAEDESALAVVKALAVGMRTAATTVDKSAQDLRAAVDTQRVALAAAAWQAAVDQASGDYQALVAALQGQRDGPQRVRTLSSGTSAFGW